MLIGPVEWIDRKIQLREGKSFKQHFPAAVGPLEWMHRNKGQVVIASGAAQAHKTVSAVANLLYKIATSNGDCGIYANVEDTMKDIAEQKFFPFWQQVEECFMPFVLENRVGTKIFPDGQTKFYSANRDGDRQQKSLRRVVCDEAHLYKKAQLSEIKNRTEGYQDLYEFYIISTGGEKPTEFSDWCDKATEYHWSPPCDACGKPMNYDFFGKRPVPIEEGTAGRIIEVDGKQMIRPFGGLVFPTGDEIWNDRNQLIDSVIEENTFYECPHCGHQHPYDPSAREERNQKALTAWKGDPLGWHGYYLQHRGSSEITVFHYSGLLHMNWWTMAKAWSHAIRARKRGDWTAVAEFYKTKVGRNFSKHFDMKSRASKNTNEGNYEMMNPGIPCDVKAWWPDMQMIIGTVDVGKDHYWVVFRAWAVVQGQLFSRLIYAGMVLSRNRLREMQHNLGVVDYGGPQNLEVNYSRRKVRIPYCMMFIDGNYDRVSNIRRLACDYSYIVYRGRDQKNKAFNKDFTHSDGVSRLFSDVELIEQWDGESSQVNPVVQMHFASARCADILWNMREVLEPEPIFTHAKNAPAEYLRHMEAWQRSGDEDEWLQQHKEDHLWDCEKMQIGVLATRGLIGDSEVVMDVRA